MARKVPQTPYEIVQQTFNYDTSDGNSRNVQETVSAPTGKSSVNGFTVSVDHGADWPGDPVNGTPSGTTYQFTHGSATATWTGLTLNDNGKSSKFDVGVSPAYITTFPGGTTVFYDVSVVLATICVTS